MSEDTIVVAIVFGSVLSIVVVSLLVSLLKTWIKQKNGSIDEEKFDRLAKAFIKYKKDSERRLQNLEMLESTDPEAEAGSSSGERLEETQLHNSIEIDQDTSADNDESKSGGGNLRNMLKD